MIKATILEHNGIVNKLFRTALLLAIGTIAYNIVEGLISVYVGLEDESLTLFGFGVDSFIEVVSGLSIAHMVWRIKRNPNERRDRFERVALRITGSSFFILAAGLTVTGGFNVYTGHRPDAAMWGIAIAAISIITMSALIYGKTKVGKKLNSNAILADAKCTRVCVYMSLVLLFSSAMYEIFRLPYIDVIGSLGLAYFSFNEGKECFEKAQSQKEDCSCT